MPNRLTKGRALLGSTSIDRDLDVRGDATFHGATAGLRSQYLAKSADHAVTAAESGATFVNTKGSGSTVFSLPATVAGLVYTFLESNASGEIPVRPVAADKIMGGGLTALDDKDVVNTGGTNAVGDLVTLIGDGADGWWITHKVGTWARES